MSSNVACSKERATPKTLDWFHNKQDPEDIVDYGAPQAALLQRSGDEIRVLTCH
jgi:hypothetical protein